MQNFLDLEETADTDAILPEVLRCFRMSDVPPSLWAVFCAAVHIASQNSKTEPDAHIWSDLLSCEKHLTEGFADEMRMQGLSEDDILSCLWSSGLAKTAEYFESEPAALRSLCSLLAESDARRQESGSWSDIFGDVFCMSSSREDKTQGVVLTPRHVADLMALLCEIDSRSVVYDSCAGSGVLLMAAASASEGKAVLIGTEKQENMWLMLAANMASERGRWHARHGNSSQASMLCALKEHAPDVGLLNPPYSEKTHELEYLRQLLQVMKPGGLVCALLPMRCAVSSAGETKRLKGELLAEHTLKAVISMPDGLFHDSGASSVSCLMLFHAKQTHSENSKVFWGRLKDDGFEVHKAKGRIDRHGKWDDIKNLWLERYRSKESVPLECSHSAVSSGADISPEKHIETEIDMKIFGETVFEYVSYLFSSKIIAEASSARAGKYVGLDPPEKWKFCKLENIFKIEGSKTTRHAKPGEKFWRQEWYPYVTTRASMNGVECFYPCFTEKGGVIAVDSAVSGLATWQAKDFTASDHVEKLVPKFTISSYAGIFIVAVLNSELWRYNYGRKRSQQSLRSSTIRLPYKHFMIDWEGMENYIKGLPYSRCLPI